MSTPIVAYRPKLTFQPLDEAGAPAGAAVDVSCDMRSVELGADVAITSVPTFCGIFQVPGDVEPSASFAVTVMDDTSTRWAGMVGVVGEFKLWDRAESAGARRFKSMVSFDPSLYGPTEPGESRDVDFDVPVLEGPTYVVGAYTPPV